MSDLLFASSSMVLTSFVSKLRSQKNNTKFQTERDGLILSILESIMKYTDVWDRNTSITASYIGIQFIGKLTEGVDTNNSAEDFRTDYLDGVFAALYRFSLEVDLSATGDIEFDVNRMKNFAASDRINFSPIAGSQIDYANSSLPIGILKGIVNTSGFKSLNEFLRVLNDSKQERDDIINEQKAASERYKSDALQKESDWQKYITEKNAEINQIKTALDSYETAFNFVGLYDGFKSLSKDKSSEKRWSLFFVISLGILVFAPLAWEVLASSPERKFNNIYDVLYLIPIFSITLILVYYFRVALQSYSSIKAQLSQIELRKTLCQFIQSYGKYSSKMKKEDPESLTKFESIIFSGIITNGENIPSTFDGLEQIVKLVGELKK